MELIILTISLSVLARLSSSDFLWGAILVSIVLAIPFLLSYQLYYVFISVSVVSCFYLFFGHTQNSFLCFKTPISCRLEVRGDRGELAIKPGIGHDSSYKFGLWRIRASLGLGAPS